MSGIFGILGINDNERVRLNTIGQDVVYEATQELLARWNRSLMEAMSAFVDGTTTDYTLRYKLPGGGRLQRLGRQGRPGAVKATGEWDVAFPLEGYGAQLGGSDVDLAYMSIQDYSRHLQTVFLQATATARYELLKALLNNAQDTFVDPLYGSLSIEPLANGDSVLYPPVLGSESEATEDHYLESGYLATAISDTNNPYITIRQELEEHFGVVTGGDSIVCLIHTDEVPETEDLTDFVAVPDNWVRPGVDTAVPVGLPNVPGRIIGRTNGCWVSEWRWVPSGYIMGFHADAPRPLKMRVDEADTGLGSGLQLIAEEERAPLSTAFWRHRFGFGGANRLNGVIMELANGGTYSVPSGY